MSYHMKPPFGKVGRSKWQISLRSGPSSFYETKRIQRYRRPKNQQRTNKELCPCFMAGVQQLGSNDSVGVTKLCHEQGEGRFHREYDVLPLLCCPVTAVFASVRHLQHWWGNALMGMVLEVTSSSWLDLSLNCSADTKMAGCWFDAAVSPVLNTTHIFGTEFPTLPWVMLAMILGCQDELRCTSFQNV